MLVVGPVEHDGCAPPHTAQEERHVQRRGDFNPEFVRRGQDVARRLPVVAQMENYLQPVDPVFAPHLSNRNYPSSLDHFFTSDVFVIFKVFAGHSDRYWSFFGIFVFFSYFFRRNFGL
jgi:hypothetical protein